MQDSDTESERAVIHHGGNSACQDGQAGGGRGGAGADGKGGCGPEFFRRWNLGRRRDNKLIRARARARALHTELRWGGVKCVLTDGLVSPSVHTAEQLSGGKWIEHIHHRTRCCQGDLCRPRRKHKCVFKQVSVLECVCVCVCPYHSSACFPLLQYQDKDERWHASTSTPPIFIYSFIYEY